MDSKTAQQGKYTTRYNILIKQGATYTLVLVYQDSSGSAIDLTGADVRMQIRTSKGASTSEDDLSITTGHWTLTDPTAGEATLSIPASETDAYSFTTGVYDVEIELPSGYVYRALEGRVDVSEAVTTDSI